MSNIDKLESKYRKMINDNLEIHKDKPYLKGYVNFMTDASIRTKYSYLKIIIRFMEGKEIDKLSFDDFNNYIEEIKYDENGKSITSSYQILTYSAMKKFCKYLYKSKRISDNYMLEITKPKRIESQKTIEKRSKGFLTETEIKELLNNVENYSPHQNKIPDWCLLRDKAMIYTFLNTGIRCSALVTITLDDLNLQEKTLMVTDKGYKVRQFDLSDSLCEVLSDWLACRKTVMGYSDNNALFISNRRQMMTAQNVRLTIKKYSACIQGKNITPHKLRATYGTQLYNKTGDIYFVQDCMGHSNPQTTELYVREKRHNTKRASDIMSGLF